RPSLRSSAPRWRRAPRVMAERSWSMRPERRSRPRVRQKKPSPLRVAAISRRTNPSPTSTGKTLTAKLLAPAVVDAMTVHGTAAAGAAGGMDAVDAGAARAAIVVHAAAGTVETARPNRLRA